MQQAWCKVFGVKEAPRAKGGGHVEHHAETLDDMSLKADPKWRASAPAAVLVDDPYRGTKPLPQKRRVEVSTHIHTNALALNSQF